MSNVCTSYRSHASYADIVFYSHLSHAQHAPLTGKRVEIHGTDGKYNGKCGVATDSHIYREGGESLARIERMKDRYTVQLDGGEVFKVKLANVRAEGAGSGAGKAKKGKAKGKKGRRV